MPYVRIVFQGRYYQKSYLTDNSLMGKFEPVSHSRYGNPARSQQLRMHGGYPLVNHFAKAGYLFEKNMHAKLFVQDTDIKLYV